MPNIVYLKRYHFNVAGQDDQLGFTAAVWSTSKKRAVELLNDFIDTGDDLKTGDFEGGSPNLHRKTGEPDRIEGIEYINVWTNGLLVREKDIDEVDGIMPGRRPRLNQTGSKAG